VYELLSGSESKNTGCLRRLGVKSHECRLHRNGGGVGSPCYLLKGKWGPKLKRFIKLILLRGGVGGVVVGGWMGGGSCRVCARGSAPLGGPSPLRARASALGEGGRRT